MAFDAVDILLNPKRIPRESNRHFTFMWLASQILLRQAIGKDTIIIITGDRRQGKSNWGLKLTRAYIRLRRKQDKNFSWSWAKNFPISRARAEQNASVMARMGFIFYDEGGDQFYRQETNKKGQRDLIKFMNKSGERGHMTIICWPDPYTLDPKLLNMAHLLVIVPYRAGYICSFAFIYGRSNNPLNYDKFGIEKIRKRFMTSKTSVKAQIPTMAGKMKVMQDGKEVEITYPAELFKFLRSIPTFLYNHKFNAVDKKFEEMYIKKVKAPQLMSHKEDDYVTQAEFDRLQMQYRTLLYNLYQKDDKSYAQLERLHIDSTGNHIRNIQAIKRDIDSIRAIASNGS